LQKPKSLNESLATENKLGCEINCPEAESRYKNAVAKNKMADTRGLGTDVTILKMFSPKNLTKMLAFLLKPLPLFANTYFIIALVF
jgi:hypothetical protein